MAINLTELTKKLPLEINGWKKSPQHMVYTPENLYDYIDGGAELYISYNFRNMLAQKYGKEGLPGITVDIFEMGDSCNAFGVFSHSREAVDHSIAPYVESEYGSGLLTFWKGSYYVSIMAYPETVEKKKTVLALGQHIAGLIDRESRKPTLLLHLPAKNLAKESIRYFRHYAWLNNHYFISSRDILHIGKESEAVLARYKEKGQIYFVLLVSYPGKAKAESGRQSFIKNYLPGAREGIKRLENGRWCGCKREGNLIMVVLSAPDAAKVKELLNGFGGN